jgi:hypothetical protein
MPAQKNLLGEGHQHQRERQPGGDEAGGRHAGRRQAEVDEDDDDQRRQRAEQVDDEDDQQVDRPQAQAAQQRERQSRGNAADDHQRGELERDQHAVGDVGQVLRHHLGVEERLDEAVPVGHRRSRRFSAAGSG